MGVRKRGREEERGKGGRQACILLQYTSKENNN